MPTRTKILIGGILAGFLTWELCIGEGVLLHTAWAQVAGPDKPAPTGINDLLEKMGIFFDFLMVIMYTALKLLSTLLDPAVITEINKATVAGEGGTSLLQYLWMISRNIVNVIFAFILIAVALYTTFTGSQVANAATISKFVVALILVNFSWFFSWVIFDVANVLTATIYSIPSEAQSECRMIDRAPDGSIEHDEPCLYVQKVFLFADATSEDEEARDCVTTADRDNNANLFRRYGFICVELSELPANTNTGLGMLHGLYINHIRIIGLGKVIHAPAPADGGWASMSELTHFAVQFIFVCFYTIAAAFPLMAMLIAFLIRIPIIWLTVAGMPFIFIGFVLGGLDKVGTTAIGKMFLRAVFLPTVVAAALTTGFIIINAGMRSDCNGFAADSVLKPLCTGSGFRLEGVTTWWQLLWAFIGMAVMWMGTFMAFSKMGGPFAAIGGFFQSVGGRWGKFFAQAPLALPVIPMGGGRTESPLSLGKGIARTFTHPVDTLIGPDNKLGISPQDQGQRAGVQNALQNNDVKRELQKIREAITRNENPERIDVQALAQALKGKEVNVRAMLTESNIGNDNTRGILADKIQRLKEELERAGRT